MVTEKALGTLAYKSPTYYEHKAPIDLDWRQYRPPSYLSYRKEWERRGQEGDYLSFPLHLDLDPTNRCNLSCVMCPRTHYLATGNMAWAPHGLGDMDFALYSRLIGEASQEGAMSVKLNFLGEPLLNRRLPEMVSVAREHKLWVMINTNAVLLDPKMSRSLLEAGLTDIFFSFDSPYLEEYERIRVGAKYQKTLANIASFMAIKEELGLNYVQTRASMVLPEDPYRRKDIQRDYIKLFRDLKVAEIGFGLPTVMERDYSSLNPKGFFRCPDLFRRIFIFQDGVAGPCCGDWERRLVVGDANTESLKEIWNNDSYRALRAAHLTGEYQSVPACKVCSVPYLSQISL